MMVSGHSENSKIYHILSTIDWAVAQAEGVYRPPCLESEGFIHCSTGGQVLRTANLYYAGRDDLLILCIAVDRVQADIHYEDSVGAGMDFPHIYGPLNLDAVEKVLRLEIGPSGKFYFASIS